MHLPAEVHEPSGNVAAASAFRPVIFVVEDDEDIARLISHNLQASGFEVQSFVSGASVLTEAVREMPALFLLDVMLPGTDGFELCRHIRQTPALSATPIIFLTAKTGEADRVKGLELGGDDYITKPFSPRELVLRIKKLLQRGQAPAEPVDTLRFGDLLLDAPRHAVSWQGKLIDLTATEFKLLTVLAQRRGRVQSREQLLRDVWEYNSLIDTRTVDTHMRRLREKLGEAAKHLDTVRGVGYRFVEA